MANTFYQNNLTGANTSGDYLTIKKAKAMALTKTNRKRRNNFENNLLFSKGFIESHPNAACKETGVMKNKDLLDASSTVAQNDHITFLGGYSYLGTRIIAAAERDVNNDFQLTYNPPLTIGTDAGTPYTLQSAHFFPYTKVSIDRDADGKLTF